MRILIGADTYAPDVNGAARFAHRLASGMADRGHDVHVVCPSADGQPGTVGQQGLTAGQDGPTVHRLRSVRYPFHSTLRACLPWQAATETRDVVKALKPDLVHVQSHMVIGRGLVRAATRFQRPLIATNHFMPENVFSYMPYVPPVLHRRAKRWLWRDLAAVFGPADLVTAPTPRAVELLRLETGIDARAVSCGIDLDRYRDAASGMMQTADPMILFVGRLDPEKRVQELVRAFAELNPGQHERLEIVGDGQEHQLLHDLITRLGIGDQVRLRGHVSDDDLLECYRRAAVFCMPGVAELQSLVTLEAMSAGKPVVAADAMALPHLVHPGENGWLYQPGNTRDLAMRLAALLKNPALARQMGERSRRIAAGHALNATLDCFEELYAETLDRTSARSVMVPAA